MPDFNLSKEQKAELVLNALVAIVISNRKCRKAGILYLMVKCDAHAGRCGLRLVERHSRASELLVVESGENAALCLLAQPCVLLRVARCSWATPLKS